MKGFAAPTPGPHSENHAWHRPHPRQLDCKGASCVFQYALADGILDSTAMRKCEDFFHKLEEARIVLQEIDSRFNDPEAEPKGPLVICDTASLEEQVKERWAASQATDCPSVSGEVMYAAARVMPRRFALHRHAAAIVVVSEATDIHEEERRHHGIAEWRSLQDSGLLRMDSEGEEAIWLAVEALVGGIAFAHALGHNFCGSLTGEDVAVRHSSSMGTFEFAMPPPFSMFSKRSTPSLVDGEIQGADVSSIAQIISSLLSAPGVSPQQRYSAELTFLIKKMTSSAETRPTASQIMEFQAVKLRIRRRMLAAVAQNGRLHWQMQRRQLLAQVEMLKSRVAIASAGPQREQLRHSEDISDKLSHTAANDFREHVLQERELKLQKFLELYEITTQTLDELPIDERSVNGLKGLLQKMATTQPSAPPRHAQPDAAVVAPATLQQDMAIHSSSRHLVGLAPSIRGPSPNATPLPPSSRSGTLRPTTPPPTSPAIGSTGGLSTPLANRSTPVADMPSPLPNIELSVNADTPPEALKRFGGSHSPCAHPPPPPQLLNDSCDIEVIELDTSVDDTSTKYTQQEDVHRAKERPRQTRRHHSGAESSASTVDSCAAWMDHHVAELDMMQQELHRSRVTPPKYTNQLSSSRRSPSTNRTHTATSRARVSGTTATSAETEDPSAILRKLREAVTV